MKAPSSCLPRSRIITIVLFAVLLLSPFVLSSHAASETPATEWDRTYGAMYGVSAFSTGDGGYVIAGTTGDWLNTPIGGGSWTNETLMLIKTDATGEVQWRKNYIKGMMRSAVLTNDGGYAIAKAGKANLMRIDSQGNI